MKLAATFVINLAGSVDRWLGLQPILEQMSAPAQQRFEAVNGMTLGLAGLRDLQESGRLAKDLAGFDANCTLGEIGCALSHAGVLAEVVRLGLPTAMILEDDIALRGPANTWRERCAAAFDDLPPTWELWYLYRCFDVEHRTVRLTPRTVAPWRPLGGAAYAVTQSGARKLLAALTPVASAVDRVYERLVQERLVEAYAASPLLVDPGSHASIINRDNPAKRWMKGGVNTPPEYWPEHMLAHLGETPPSRPSAGLWNRMAARARRLAGLAP